MKLDRRARAEDPYISPWFRKARVYVSRIGAPWKFLSAKHGLISPRSLVEPYDGDEVVMAVFDREFVASGLRVRGVRVDVPLAGIGLGMQLSWFDDGVRKTNG